MGFFRRMFGSGNFPSEEEQKEIKRLAFEEAKASIDEAEAAQKTEQVEFWDRQMLLLSQAAEPIRINKEGLLEITNSYTMVGALKKPYGVAFWAMQMERFQGKNAYGTCPRNPSEILPFFKELAKHMD